MSVRKTFLLFCAIACHAMGLAALPAGGRLTPPRAVEGHLANGLRYIIIPNGVPGKKVEYRLVMRVGSVHESAGQKGCAHFLEHVSFCGSRHFPDKTMVSWLESLGMKFGIDINAYTGLDRTVFMFSTPSDIRPKTTMKAFAHHTSRLAGRTDPCGRPCGGTRKA